jgi:conjugal transfer/entry exclusion protein
MTPFYARSDTEQLADWLGERLARMEDRMATKAQVEQSFNDLTATLTDYTSDVTAALGQLRDGQAAMQQTIDRLTSDDAADKALIADLQARLTEQVGITDTVVARASNLTDAVKAADQPIDQPPAGQPA